MDGARSCAGQRIALPCVSVRAFQACNSALGIWHMSVCVYQICNERGDRAHSRAIADNNHGESSHDVLGNIFQSLPAVSLFLESGDLVFDCGSKKSPSTGSSKVAVGKRVLENDRRKERVQSHSRASTSSKGKVCFVLKSRHTGAP